MSSVFNCKSHLGFHQTEVFRTGKYFTAFALRNKARELKQGDLDVTCYFDELTKLWQQPDVFNDSD